MSRHVTPCHDMSRHVTPHVTPCHDMSRYVTPHVTICHDMSRYVTPQVTPCHSHATPCHTYFKTYLAKTTTLSRNIRHNICGERHRTTTTLHGQECGGLYAATSVVGSAPLRHSRRARVLQCVLSDFGTIGAIAEPGVVRLGWKTKARSNDHHHGRIEPLRLCVAVGLILWFAAGAHDQSECHIANACCLCRVLESMYALSVVACCMVVVAATTSDAW